MSSQYEQNYYFTVDLQYYFGSTRASNYQYYIGSYNIGRQLYYRYLYSTRSRNLVPVGIPTIDLDLVGSMVPVDPSTVPVDPSTVQLQQLLTSQTRSSYYLGSQLDLYSRTVPVLYTYSRNFLRLQWQVLRYLGTWANDRNDCTGMVSPTWLVLYCWRILVRTAV